MNRTILSYEKVILIIAYFRSFMLVEENIRTVFSSKLSLKLLVFYYIELGHFGVVKKSPTIFIYFCVIEIVTCMNTTSLVDNKSLELIILDVSFDGVIPKNLCDSLLSVLEPIDVKDENFRFVDHSSYLY